MDKPEDVDDLFRAIEDEQRFEDWLAEPSGVEGMTKGQFWDHLAATEYGEDWLLEEEMLAPNSTGSKLHEMMKNPKPMPAQPQKDAPQQKQQDRGVEK